MKKVLMISLLLLVGCGPTVSSSRIPGAPLRPQTEISPYDVALLFTEEELEAFGECQQIAFITSKGDGGFWGHDQNDLSAKIREEAAKQGANAVLIYEMTRPSTSARIAGLLVGGGVSNSQSATAYYCES